MPIPVFLVQHHLGSPINTGIISQCCQSKQRTAASRKYIRYVILLDEIQQNRTRFGYTAADYKNFRVHHSGNICQLFTQDFTETLRHFNCQLVPFFYRIKNCFCGNIRVVSQRAGLIVLLQPALRQPYNTGSRGILLQAAVIAAVASFALSVHHMDMADLACCPR